METPKQPATSEAPERGRATELAPRDLELLHARLRRAFAGRRVLELGCGAGEWTRVYAERAAGVTAVEASEAPLSRARAAHWPEHVEFVRADYEALPDFGRTHDALFSPGLWSETPENTLDAFLRRAVDAVAPGALIAFLGVRGTASESDLIRRATRCGWGAHVELLPGFWLLTWWGAR